MADTLQEIAQKILEASNGGFDIIQKIYPNADPKKAFRIREDDKTQSCHVKSYKGIYRLTDFGGTLKGEDGIGIYADWHKIDYWEAIVALGKEYGFIQDKGKETYKADYAEFAVDKCPVKLNEKGFYYKVKDFTDLDFLLLGPEISTKNEEGLTVRKPLISEEVCTKVNFFALEEYYIRSADGTKVHRFRANESYPMFAFINEDDKIGEWLKVYMPKATKRLSPDGKDRRFFHLGGRPKDFIFGFDQLQDFFDEAYDTALAKLLEKARTDEERTEIENEHEKSFKLERICIATGGSDGLNLLALGEFTIWFNSETAEITKELFDELSKYAHSIINIPDCDTTGIREGRANALKFLTLKTLWLNDYPEYKGVKDFKDYAFRNKNSALSKVRQRTHTLLERAKHTQFWDVIYSDKTKKTTYNFNVNFGLYFLEMSGFCRVDDEARKDGYYFARITNHIVEELEGTTKIKNFFKDFLEEKQKELGVRKIPHELLNNIMTSQRLSENQLLFLNLEQLDFTSFDTRSQYFFFNNETWRVDKNGISVAPKNDKFVLKSQIIEELITNQTSKKVNSREFKISEDPYFDIKPIGEDFFDIEIKEKECDFLNFIIQTSRVFWEEEKANYIEKGYSEKDFFEKTKFNIAGDYLSTDQKEEQKQHLVNKIFTIGYMLHRYKDLGKPWIPYAVDNSVQEDRVAEGGSGKSVFFSSLDYILNFHTVNGKDDLEQDKFWLENVSKHTAVIFIDDVKRGFDLEFLYQLSTGKMSINTKFQSKAVLNYNESPKFAVSSNHSLRDMNGSSIRRRLLISFSNYYHAKSEKYDKREIYDDFGYNLYSDWDDKQWNKFVNFLLQCLKFYLSHSKKIEAPDNNIMRRAWLSEMGVEFQDWADNYYPHHSGVELMKLEVEMNVKHFAENKNYKWLKGLTPNSFKSKTKAWCKFNDYEFEDRILKSVKQPDGTFQSREHIKLTRNFEDGETIPEDLNPVIEEPEDKTIFDD